MNNPPIITPPAAAAPLRIGLFGGAFDPPHNGHVAMARAAIAQAGLAALHIVPTGGAYHKSRPLSPAPQRLAMARLAFAQVPQAVVDDTEIRRAGASHAPSYTIDTLRELRARQPQAQLFLLIGQDQAAQFMQWREPQQIVQIATLLIAQRPANTCRSPVLTPSAWAAPSLRPAAAPPPVAPPAPPPVGEPPSHCAAAPSPADRGQRDLRADGWQTEPPAHPCQPEPAAYPLQTDEPPAHDWQTERPAHPCQPEPPAHPLQTEAFAQHGQSHPPAPPLQTDLLAPPWQTHLPAQRWQWLHWPAQPVSSTQVRALAAAGQSLAHLVPPGVAGYIAQHRLYNR